MSNGRIDVSDASILAASEAAIVALGRRIEQHGRDSFASAHESLGIITEEYQEYIEAVRSNDPILISNEVMNLVVSGLFTIASMIEGEKRFKSDQNDLDSLINEAKSKL